MDVSLRNATYATDDDGLIVNLDTCVCVCLGRTEYGVDSAKRANFSKLTFPRRKKTPVCDDAP